MKHVFPGGIVATSNDSIGDEFLAGMIRQRDLEDDPTEAEKMRQRIRHQHLLIAALVLKAGGRVELDPKTVMDAYLGLEIIERDDVASMNLVVTVRPKK